MGKAKRYLIIDDNPIDMLLAATMVKKAMPDIEILRIQTAKDALHWLANNGPIINEGLVILLDIRMPEMDGFEFLEEFGKLDEQIKTPCEIYMLSSTVDPKDMDRSSGNSLVKGFITKPLSAEKIRSVFLTT